MGNIDFDRMDKYKRVTKLYTSMWSDNKFVNDANIAKTFVDEAETKCSDNSYSFKRICKEGKDDALIREFKITNPDEKSEFRAKYKLACSGDGQEEKRITTLHSSSLCALLCFYNVKERPIEIEICNGSSKQLVKFNYSVFEYKNPVINKDSNIDVVLVSEDKKVILFLESKFSEYYVYAKTKSGLISKKYLDPNNTLSCTIYQKMCEDGIITLNDSDTDDDEFYISTVDGSMNYLDGIKQMISHYVGVSRRLSEMTEYNDEIISEALNNKDSKVYLGEILFDNFETDINKANGSKKILDRYAAMYKSMAGIMNVEIKKSKNKKFIVLEKELGYKEVFEKNRNRINKTILEFYGI